MRRIINYYRLQIDVMRKWRPRGRSRIRRILATLIISVLSFGGAVWLTPGFDLAPGTSWVGAGLVAAVVLGVLNILVRPLLLALFAGVSVIAVVVVTLAFQIVSFLILPRFVSELHVSGILSAFVAS